MHYKFIEIRDRATCIPAIAIAATGMTHIEKQAFRYSGYSEGEGHPAIILTRLTTGNGENDPYNWKDARTMRAAHSYLEKNFWKIESGSVLDVRVILKEESEACLPEVFK